MRSAFSKAEIESEITSRFGTSFKLREKTPAAVLSTGILEVDSLSGGLPRGAITEICGPASSGRTSLMLSTLAYATTHEEVCALVDTNDALDLTSAALADVDFEQLLWIRCAGNFEHAFKATDLLLQAGGFGFVVLDIADVPVKDARRIISSWWYRFRRVVEDTPTAFVVLAQEPCVRSCASLAFDMRKDVDVWSSPSGTLPDFAAPNTQSQIFAFGSRPPAVIQRQSSTSYKKIPQPLQATHSMLLRGERLVLECRKPIFSAEQAVRFNSERRLIS